MNAFGQAGQHVVVAALVLLASFGPVQLAFAAPVTVDPSNEITDFTVNEDTTPNTFDLQSVFTGGVDPITYAVTANSNASAVVATTSGTTLTLTYTADAS